MGISLKYRVLQFSVFILLILSVLFLFNACNKDKEFADPPFTVRNDATSAILSKINFDLDGNILLNTGSSQVVLKHASIEKQREVSDYIFDNLSFTRIDSMREIYGLPVWELAIIKDINLEGELYNASNKQIVVPLVQDNKLTGIIFYENINNTVNATLYDDDDIELILSKTREDNTFFETFFPVIVNYQIMNILIERKNIENFNNWIENAFLKINSSQIRPRYVWIDCYEIVTQYYNPETFTETIKYETKCILRIGGGGGNVLPPNGNFGSNIGSGGNAGGNGTFGDGDENNYGPKVDKAKKLKCAIEVADFMAQTEVLELIANNNLTDPCDPEKSAADMLEQALSGYCYAKSGDAPLNLQDAEHFMGEIMEGFDNIENKISNSKINCIYEKFNDIDDQLFCNSIQNFFGDTPINLVFLESDDIRGQAVTRTDYKNGRISITFNSNYFDYNYCEITFFTMFLHEGIHAEIFRQNYLEWYNLPYNKAEIWNNWDKKSEHHDNIAKSYMPYIIETLKLEYGDRYSNIEYEALAWLGLGIGPGGNTTEAWENLDDTKKEQLNTAFETLNNKCENDECK